MGKTRSRQCRPENKAGRRSAVDRRRPAAGQTVMIAVVLALALAAPPAPSSASEERTVTIDTRPGVTVGLALVDPPGRPVASVILFIGGSGTLALWRRRRPLPLDRGNFLVRTRRMFAAHGFLTALVDVPSDRREDELEGFRHTVEHRRDIEAVVAWLRNRADVPVWLIGTSRGTVSVAHLAATMKIDGAVLTASVTGSGRRVATVLDARLEDVTAPVLVVHNRDDDCGVTPSHNMDMIKDRLIKSAAAEVMMFSGGTPSGHEVCGPLSYHGFLGIERKVVDAIAGWIKARRPMRPIRPIRPTRPIPGPK